MNGDWIDDQIESWVLNSNLIDDKEREFLVQFFVKVYPVEVLKLDR